MRPHEPALKGDLTALENLRFMIGLKRRSSNAELTDCLERTGVASCADLPVRVLSAGQRRRVAMARVLGMRAALWLLDEPFTNLDAAGSEIFATLHRGACGQRRHGGGRRAPRARAPERGAPAGTAGMSAAGAMLLVVRP